MNNANYLTLITNNIKGINNKSKRLSVVEYFKNKLGNNEILFLHIPHLMMKIFGRMTSIFLFFTHMVPLSHVVSNLNFLVKKHVGDKNGRILILDVNIDEIRYVLVNIYNANTEVEQVQVLSELCELRKNIHFSKENRIVLAGDLNVIFDSKVETKGGKLSLKQNLLLNF